MLFLCACVCSFFFQYVQQCDSVSRPVFFLHCNVHDRVEKRTIQRCVFLSSSFTFFFFLLFFLLSFLFLFFLVTFLKDSFCFQKLSSLYTIDFNYVSIQLVMIYGFFLFFFLCIYTFFTLPFSYDRVLLCVFITSSFFCHKVLPTKMNICQKGKEIDLCVCVRERERQTDRRTDRQTE